MKESKNKPQVLITGTIGIDTIISPFGRADNILGGSGTYFSLACRLFTEPAIIAVAGTDLPDKDRQIFRKFKINTDGLQIQEGKTFSWTGEYHLDLNTRTSLKTELNLLETFSPVIPEHLRSTPYVFLGNLHPALQLQVLKQMKSPKLVGLDTMNFWIERDLPTLTKVIKQINIFVINDEEARLLSGVSNILKSAKIIQKMMTQKNAALIIKRGEYGLLCFYKNQILSLPGYPLEDVVDPTGAGDSFAGALMGSLSQSKTLSIETLKKACIAASTTASFTVESFGSNSLQKLNSPKLQARMKKFNMLSHFVKL